MSQSLNFIVDNNKRPKHIILIGVDGGRYDYLERYPMPHFRSLIKNGVSFRNAIASNFPCLTAPGFTSLSTGLFSKEHGIFTSYDWYDKKTGKLRYFFDDKKGTVDLIAPTICDVVKAVNPEAKIASISAKDRPSLLLAGNKADIVAYSYREYVSQRRDHPGKEAYTGAGVHEDYYCWAERPNRQLPPYLRSTRLARTVNWKGKGFNHPNQDPADTPAVDTFIMDAALEILKNEQPYLMFIVLVSSNIVPHAYSPDSPESQNSFELIDREVGRLVDLLKEMGRYEDTLIVIAADHGMTVKPECVSIEAELEKNECHDIMGNICYVSPGAGAGIYLKDTNPITVRRTIQVIQGMPHIQEVWYKYDSVAPWFVKRAASERAPDIFIVPKADAVIVPAGYPAPSFPNGHGSPYPADANIMMVFSGTGVKKLGSLGEPLDLSSCKLITDEEVENLPEQVDVAPTMKRIMGLPTSS